jgi:hypothetical protein
MRFGDRITVACDAVGGKVADLEQKQIRRI